MRDALDTRGVIGQAVGMLMARHGLGAGPAFDRLKSRPSTATRGCAPWHRSKKKNKNNQAERIHI